MAMNSFWNHKWFLALTAPVLLALSFPPFNASILQIPAFVLLFRLSVISDTKREAIFYAYPSFVLWNLFSTYWLMMATVAGGAAAIFANAAIMLIPLLLIRFVINQNRFHPLLTGLLAASIWVSYEFLHHNWDLAWPWLTLGNGWSNLTSVIQFISVTGVFGISFWVILTAFLCYHWLVQPERKHLIYTLAAFFIFPIWSIFSLTQIESDESRPVEVAIVQPNTDSYQSLGGHPNLESLIEHLLRLSNEARSEQTDLIIWPENAIASNLIIDSPFFDRVKDSLNVWETNLIAGTGLFNFYDDENRPQVYRETANGRSYNVYNSALYFQPSQPTKVYRKTELVPIVERFPFVEFFQNVDLFGWVNWPDIAGYGRGTTPDLFNVVEQHTPALICYDSVFSGLVNRFVDEGADFLTIITNDGWWGDSHGHIQHFAFARLRAIEHRMWIARSANNGISGIISPDGKVQIQTEYWTEDAFRFTIYGNPNRTFYSRHGNWIGGLSLVIMGFGFIGGFIRGRTQLSEKLERSDSPDTSG